MTAICNSELTEVEIFGRKTLDFRASLMAFWSFIWQQFSTYVVSTHIVLEYFKIKGFYFQERVILQTRMNLVKKKLRLPWLKYNQPRKWDTGYSLSDQHIFSSIKVNSVQEACAKCFAVHIIKFEILQITDKEMIKERQTHSFQFFTNKSSILMLLVLLFHVDCKISNNIWTA